jgi:hypothetical protein
MQASVHAQRNDRVAHADIRTWRLGEFPRCPAHRLIRKLEDVSDELARQAPTASSLSPLGHLKHAATREQRWFQVIMAGRQSPDRWPEVMPEPHDAELIIRESDTVRHWLAVHRQHIETSKAIAASMDLRYVLFHMKEETVQSPAHRVKGRIRVAPRSSKLDP